MKTMTMRCHGGEKAVKWWRLGKRSSYFAFKRLRLYGWHTISQETRNVTQSISPRSNTRHIHQNSSVVVTMVARQVTNTTSLSTGDVA